MLSPRAMSDEPATTEKKEKPATPLGVVALVLALLLGFALLPRLFGGGSGALSGKEAPDFTLKVVANQNPMGDKPTLSLSELRGKVVILDFWASWCGPCQAEAPIVNKVAQRFSDRGLVVIGVHTSDQERNASPAARSFGISFPIVHDANDATANSYNVHNLPTLVLVSREGKVIAVRQGVTAGAELEALVQKAL